MHKRCQTCRKTNPLVIRWVMYNYGQIPWNGFLFPREKQRRENLIVVDEVVGKALKSRVDLSNNLSTYLGYSNEG